MLAVALEVVLTTARLYLGFGAGFSFSIFLKNSGADMVYLSVLCISCSSRALICVFIYSLSLTTSAKMFQSLF